MLIKKPRRWELPENLATPEHIFVNRRKFLLGAAAGGIAAAAAPGLVRAAEKGAGADPTVDLYPVARNDAYSVERAVTKESVASFYNNFYEFGSHKRIAAAAQALPIRPWEVRIDGLVQNPQTIGIDDLIRRMPLEERLYRHRCVEAWSMVVPWTGFPVSEIVKLADPKAEAKFLRMETFLDKDIAPGQRQFWYPWPYVEGLTIEEAGNDLAFLVTGVYGKPLAKQFGAPLRLAVPWKYGFKSIKSIVRFTFTDERPVTFWEDVNSDEYGFWANVNPEVPHPRWSQATEEVLGTNERVPTRLFNGYAEQVAGLYKGMNGRSLYM